MDVAGNICGELSLKFTNLITPQQNHNVQARSHHLRSTPKVKVGVHLRCKDQKNRARRFAFCCAHTPKIIVKAISTPPRRPTPRRSSSGLSAWNAPWRASLNSDFISSFIGSTRLEV